MISLKQSDSELYNISRSLYSVKRLITAQGLNSYFDRADHRKKKRLVEAELIARKKLRV
jgi:hypothetical protein